MIRMLKLTTAMFMALSPVAALAQASDEASETTPSDPIIIGHSHHSNNRAVAFGSILIAASGSDIATWQAVDASNWCDNDSTLPIPLPDPDQTNDDGTSDDSQPSDPISFPSSCWDVAVTTGYDLFVCPNGQPSILRHGVGVTLENRSSGEVYSWSELTLCSDDGLFTKDKNGRTLANDKHRPLNFKSLKRQPRR